jgi:hypothetical protein
MIATADAIGAAVSHHGTTIDAVPVITAISVATMETRRAAMKAPMSVTSAMSAAASVAGKRIA